jgi:hypothetical protein
LVPTTERNNSTLGSKIKKTYDKPRTPFDRAASDCWLAKKFKDNLIAGKAAVDLMNEMAVMNKAIDKLRTLADPVPLYVSKRGFKPLLFGFYGLIF